MINVAGKMPKKMVDLSNKTYYLANIANFITETRFQSFYRKESLSAWRCVCCAQPVQSLPLCASQPAMAGRMLATCNNSVQTSSLQCFREILKGCSVLTLGQITEK